MSVKLDENVVVLSVDKVGQRDALIRLLKIKKVLCENDSKFFLPEKYRRFLHSTIHGNRVWRS